MLFVRSSLELKHSALVAQVDILFSHFIREWQTIRQRFCWLAILVKKKVTFLIQLYFFKLLIDINIQRIDKENLVPNLPVIVHLKVEIYLIVIFPEVPLILDFYHFDQFLVDLLLLLGLLDL